MSRWPVRSLRERFFEKVDITPGCWLWTASQNNKGYGQIGILGAKRPATSHRVSWELHHGQIPPGLHALHQCDTPACVNPAHLFLGTHAENMADKNRKGRGNYHFKLTEAQVLEIRRRRAAGEPLKSLAAAFDSQKSTISRIANGVRRPGVR